MGDRGASGLAFYIYFVQDAYKIKRSGAVPVDQYIYIYIYKNQDLFVLVIVFERAFILYGRAFILF